MHHMCAGTHEGPGIRGTCEPHDGGGVLRIKPGSSQKAAKAVNWGWEFHVCCCLVSGKGEKGFAEALARWSSNRILHEALLCLKKKKRLSGNLWNCYIKKRLRNL